MARRRVQAELRRHRIADEIVDRLVLATAEACNNAIAHSHCTTYVITVDVRDDQCVIAVIDSGGGFQVPDRIEMPEPQAVARRGLAIMSALVDDIELSSTAAGTTVVLRQALGIRVAQPVAATA
jgi:anti-sigma regulatory factor (Ser/Thr protein kinase)